MARTARNTAQISALIEPEQRQAMDSIADDFQQSFADVLREVIEEGLPAVRARYEAKRRFIATEAERAARRG